MAISDRIQAMYTHTSDIYDSVELTGVDTTDIDKNLVNVPNTLKEGYIDIINNGTDTLYNNFPKVSGEGTSLTLNNTYQAPMRNNLKGNTSQTQYSGKNLLPPTIATETKNGITLTNNGDGSYTLTGSYSGSSTTFDMALPATLNGTYSFSGNNPASSNNIQFRILKSSGSPWSTYLNKVNSISEDNTIENGITQEVRIVGSFTSGFTFKPQLESGSTATSYEPYVGGVATPNPTNPIPVNVVSGDNDIVISGKNLFNKDGNLTNGYLNSNGSISSNNSYRVSDYIDVSQYSNITISGNAGGSEVYCFYDSTKTFTGANSMGSNTSKTISIDSGVAYIRTTINANNLNTYQVEKGSSVSAYEPYQGNTYNIDLPVENLFDKDNANIINSYFNNTTPTLSSLGNSYRSIYIPCKPNIKYTISKISSARYSVGYTNETPAVGVTVNGIITNNSATTITITTGANAQYLIAFIYHSTYDTTLTPQQILDSIQIEKGSKANSYTPYGTTPIELCKIGNYQDEFRKSDGTNLFDKWLSGTVNTTTGEITSVARNRSDYIEVEPNTAYSVWREDTGFATYMIEYNANKQFVVTNTITSANTTGTFTTNANTKYVILFQYTNYSPTNKAQLEKGSSATSWQPYGVGEWYKYAMVGYKLFDGTNGVFNAKHWSITSDTKGFYQIILPNKLRTSNSGLTDYVFSNYFKAVSGSAQSAFDNNSSGFWWEGSDVYSYIILEETSLTNANNWLTTHNTKIYYALETPTGEPIPTTLNNQLKEFENAKSKENQTNISQINNDLPFIISASALKKGDTIENNSASLLMSFGALPNTIIQEATPDFEEDVLNVEEETPIEESIEEEIEEGE